jgi:hypothetical protein
MKTPTHTLIRVRNNQRRHRQRRREYIVHLEQRLRDVEERLEKAQAENARLSIMTMWSIPVDQNFDALSIFSYPIPDVSQGIQHDLSQSPHVEAENLEEVSAHGRSLLLPSADPDLPSPGDLSCCHAPNPDRESHLFIDKETGLSDPNPIGDPQASCSKSTSMLCSQAYLIIHHHNRRQLGTEEVESWLRPGFITGGPLTAEGCRVDNQLLLSLLEYVTGADFIDQ